MGLDTALRHVLRSVVREELQAIMQERWKGEREKRVRPSITRLHTGKEKEQACRENEEANGSSAPISSPNGTAGDSPTSMPTEADRAVQSFLARRRRGEKSNG